MKNKLLICCFLLLTIILFTNCGRNKKNVWITTQNGYLFWGKIVDNNIEYQWEGNTFGNVINGHGVLLSYKNDTLLDKNEI
ncbi:MAG: hypothetical protein LBV66_01300, partial [Elusimicrobiota bacterium]|nr:hypothetical protein [Elusimicrobiota bacterium]